MSFEGYVLDECAPNIHNLLFNIREALLQAKKWFSEAW